MRIDVSNEYLAPVKHGNRKRVAPQSAIATRAATAVFAMTLSTSASAYFVPTVANQGTEGSAQLVAHRIGAVGAVLPPNAALQMEDRRFLKTRARIERIVRLEPGWDGTGSKAPSPVSHAAAREVVSLFESASGRVSVDGEPQVVPRPSGGFQFEWRYKSRELHVGFDDGGSLEILEVAPGREEEIVGGLERLAASIRWLIEG